MSWIDGLYLASPVGVQQAMVSVYGALWYWRRFGGPFRKMVEELRSHQRWTEEQYRAYQSERLAQILEAARRSTYYGGLMAHLGDEAGRSPFDVLSRFPLLSKETLRSRPRDLLTQTPPPAGTKIFRSSGTTGTPTEIFYSRELHAYEMAVGEARSLDWAGVDHRSRRVMFGARKVCAFSQSKPPFWRHSPAENMAYASIYHLAPTFLPHYMEFLRDYRPALVMGYPAALATVARYAMETGDTPARASAVITTSETLTDGQRRAIEVAWQCRVWDRYGAVECCVFASQCGSGAYHVSPEVGIVEILDEKGNACPPGEMGEVVCTGLRNTLQPLIRYRIGDAARWSAAGPCSCGFCGPVLQGIEGRYEDICRTVDGREMLRFDTVFKGVQNVKEAQVVQEGLGRFVVNVVPADGFGPADANLMRENLRLHVGEVEAVVRTVPAIERTNSGKFRAVVSRLAEKDPSARLGAQGSISKTVGADGREGGKP